MNSYLVDANVWLAIGHTDHVHHGTALRWWSESQEKLYFCRLTQLAILRLLTNRHVMGGSVQTQTEAWLFYDALRTRTGAGFVNEPDSFDQFFRTLTRTRNHSPNAWSDAYIGALACAAGLCVVSFDTVFHSMQGVDAIVLSA
jgi:toxin-antitoxin system PIN domain toxin